MGSTTTKRPRPDLVPIEPEPGRLAVSIPEAAWLMNIGVPLVWRLVAKGELPSFKVGRRRLIARAAIEELVARGGHVPAEAS